MSDESRDTPFRQKSLADVDPDNNQIPDPPSLLTKKQREYLAGRTDIEPKSADERSIRSRIRTRLRHLIRDMSRVSNQAEVRDIDQAFEQVDIVNLWRSSVALLLQRWAKYESLHRTNEHSPDKPSINRLEELIETGIVDSYRRRGQIVEEANISIEIKFGDKSDGIEYDELDELSQEEQMVLYESGKVSLSQIFEANSSD